MQHTAAGGIPVPLPGEGEEYDLLVLEPAALVERVQAVKDAIETAFARELASSDQDGGADLVVLDDVMPRYMKANSALQTCHTQLAEALDFLREASLPVQRPVRGTASDRPASRCAD